MIRVDGLPSAVSNLVIRRSTLTAIARTALDGEHKKNRP